MRILFILSLVLCSLSGAAQILTQEVFGSGGSESTTDNCTINTTFGQSTVGTYQTPLISPGFQQGEGLLDTVSRYNIGEIPNQTVYSEVETAFYVWSRELGLSADLSIEVLEPAPLGAIKFDARLGKFKITPDALDNRRHSIVFKAVIGQDTVSQEVLFDFVPSVVHEQTIFGLTHQGGIPSEDSKEFTIITETLLGTRQFNHANRAVRSIGVVGKQLVFDDNLANQLQAYFLSGTVPQDIAELNIYAEQVIIRSNLHLPQTNVSIYAKELIMENDVHINTTPVQGNRVNHTPLNGETAGNIKLNIECFQADFGRRFILVGGTGQNSIHQRGGSGGNGGVFTSNINMTEYADLTRGNAGVGTAYGNVGRQGSSVITNARNTWLHPYYLKMVLAHAKAAYLNGNMTYPKEVMEEYSTKIAAFQSSAEWNQLTETEQVELSQLDGEITAILYRIGSNLDYFGNSAGWVPMLSFEVNQQAFEQEIDRSIELMYFSYWFQQRYNSNEESIELIAQTKESKLADLDAVQELFEDAVDDLSTLKPQAESIEIEIESIIQDIADLEQELLTRAEYQVAAAEAAEAARIRKARRKAKFKKILGGIGKIVSVLPIPGAQPVLGIVGTGLTVIANTDFSQPLGKIAESVQNSGVTSIDTKTFKMNADTLISKFKGWKDDDISTFNNIKDAIKPTVEAAKPIIEGVKEMTEKVQIERLPIETIDQALDRLKAESPEFNELVSRVENLMLDKIEYQKSITNTIENIARYSGELQSGMLAVDGMNQKIANVGSNRDLRAVLYVRDMEQRAKERLLKYHYYMSKAYEYRLLQEYPNTLTLETLFEQLLNVISSINHSDINEDDFKRIKAIYDDALAEAASEILDKYNDNAPEKSLPLEFYLTGEDLDKLNNGETVNLNMFERGMFPCYESNIRIQELELIELETSIESGDLGSFASLDMRLEHSGISRLASGNEDGEIGQTYIFRHYNERTVSPITWNTRYDLYSGTLAPEAPSPASGSLLASILDDRNILNNENLLLYSRPGAWADIKLSKGERIHGNAKVVIEKARFRLVYDFQALPRDLTTVEVHTNNELLPYIKLDAADRFFRQDGWGTFRRSYYRTNNGKLNLDAPEQYGAWEFEAWEDFRGNIISEEPQVEVSLASDQMLHAKYKLIQPELHVPKDTLFLSSDSGLAEFEVQNIGLGEMDWVVRSDATWFSFASDTIGLNNGTAKIFHETNTESTSRESFIEIIAPSSIDYIDTLVVIQVGSANMPAPDTPLSTEAYPNPTNGTVVIQLDDRFSEGMLIVRNQQGQTVKSQAFYHRNPTFDFSDLAIGVYFVEAVNEDLSTVVKILRH